MSRECFAFACGSIAWTLLLVSAPVAAADAPMAEKSLPPQPAYASAFEGYKRYADQPVQSWQAANELVARIGGWHAYARESQAARMSSPGPQQPLPKPAVAPPRSPRQ